MIERPNPFADWREDHVEPAEPGRKLSFPKFLIIMVLGFACFGIAQLILYFEDRHDRAAAQIKAEWDKEIATRIAAGCKKTNYISHGPKYVRGVWTCPDGNVHLGPWE